MVAGGSPSSLTSALDERQATSALRSLQVVHSGVDLCSNDYLGVARRLGEPEVVARVMSAWSGHQLGATGSRLVSGSSKLHHDFEAFLANLHRAPKALLFGSGYEANLGLLSSLGGRHDTVLYDELVHASMRDGIRLGVARSYSFRHNDLSDLEEKMKRATGECYVAIESIYSMDGHRAPLSEMAALCREHGAYLIVDEAHSTGIYGEAGAGLVVEEGVEDAVFARVHTFGKAIGYRGACVVGSEDLYRFLVNFARPFIYSTAPDLLSVCFQAEAYRLVADAHAERAALERLISEWRALRDEFAELSFVDSDTAIQGVVIPGNKNVVAVEAALHAAGIFTKAIRSPTVPAGRERLRLSLHSFNGLAELRSALCVIEKTLAARATDTEGAV